MGLLDAAEANTRTRESTRETSSKAEGIVQLHVFHQAKSLELELTRPLDWAQLLDTLASHYELTTEQRASLKLLYLDEDGDWCVISSELELDGAWHYAVLHDSPLRVVLKGDWSPIEASWTHEEIAHAHHNRNRSYIHSPARPGDKDVEEHVAREGEPAQVWRENFCVDDEESAKALDAADVDFHTYKDAITFNVNGKTYSLAQVDPELKLVHFLRQTLGLTATKVGCGEGGCGACTVLMQWTDALGVNRAQPINSCLRPVATLNGCAITTNEALGSVRRGLHPVQKKLADCDGSQCGYCSSGMVMNMYSYLAQRGSDKPTKLEIEQHFDGNICRCTGFRPIMTAFHSFGSDADIEDTKPAGCTGSCTTCTADCEQAEGHTLHEQETCCSSSSSASSSSSSCCNNDSSTGCGQTTKQKRPVRSTSPTIEYEVVDNLSLLRTDGDKRNVGYMFSADHGSRSGSGSGSSGFSSMSVVSSSSSSSSSKTGGSAAVYVQPDTLDELLHLRAQYADQATRLVAGNTSIGVAKYYSPSPLDHPSVYIDVTQVPELHGTNVGPKGLTVGANMTLCDYISTLETEAKSQPKFGAHLPALVRHLKVVANAQVRSVASIAGNLMLNKAHPDFPSDVLTVLVTAKATLTVMSLSAGAQTVDLRDWNAYSLPGDAIILSVTLPWDNNFDWHVDTFKSKLRHANSHPIVNAGFNVSVDANGTITEALLVYGGVDSGSLLLADSTAAYLVGKSATSNDTLQGALAVLQKETVPTPDPQKAMGPVANPKYRQTAALGFFYQFFLTLQPSLPADLQSAAVHYERPLSQGTQSYSTDPKEAPVGSAVPKIGGYAQASGEAKYTCDEPLAENELYGAYALSTVAVATLVSIDASKALAMPGVVDFVSAADVAKVGATNNAVGSFPGAEEIFASNQVLYYGQPIGLVVADTWEHARLAALEVTAQYSNVTEPILTIQQAIAAKSYLPDNQYMSHMKDMSKGDVDKGLAASDTVLKGSLSSNGQEHFYMETQSVAVAPSEEDGLTVFVSSQGPAAVRSMLTTVFGLSASKISVTTKRAGGGFGGKLNRCHPVTAATAVAALKLGVPVRTQLDRQTDMTAMGHRTPFYAEYEVGVMKDGTINAMKVHFYADGGAYHAGGFGSNDMCLLWSDGAYDIPNFYVAGDVCKTNLAANTAMRAPGAFEGMYFVERIVERVGRQLQMSPVDVRTKNFYKVGSVTPYGQTLKYCNLETVFAEVQKNAAYSDMVAEAQAYNKANRWRKRGVGIVPTKYGINPIGHQESVIVNVYGDDGSVVVTTSGVEVGQGLNTKVAQAVAYELGVDLDMLTQGVNSTDRIPNSIVTGGSSTSEACVAAAQQACATINDRLAPFKKADPSGGWKKWVAAANAKGIDLSVNAQYDPQPSNNDTFLYFTWGAAVCYVELDVISGEVQILHTEMVFDYGQSLNPMIDIGQSEGAFVQAIGYFHTENMAYGSDGRNLIAGTWEYKPPEVPDIPLVFNVSLLEDSPNPVGILGSKASGEPPYMLGVSLLFALENAVQAARDQSAQTNEEAAEELQLPVPSTVVDLQLNCMLDISQFTLE